MLYITSKEYCSGCFSEEFDLTVWRWKSDG